MTLTDVVQEELALLEQIKRILPPDKYHDLEVFEEERGGTRAVYTAKWGKSGERKVAIKVDKLPTSTNAQVHVQRGYATQHEVDIASLLEVDEALGHHINPIIDFYEVDDMTIAIEPWFEGARSLKKIVEQEGPLNVKDFRQVFPQILKAVQYLITEKKLYHRDLNPSNILIRRGKKGLEARLTDLANACKIADAAASARPTMGARMIANPFISERFTGSPGTYNERCEIYALGVNMLYALTGKTAFEFDIDTGAWRQFAPSIRPIVDTDGRVDHMAYNWSLLEAVKDVPWKIKHTRDLIFDCMTPQGDAISSIDDLVMRFDRIHNSVWNRNLFIFAAVGIAAMVTVLVPYVIHAL